MSEREWLEGLRQEDRDTELTVSDMPLPEAWKFAGECIKEAGEILDDPDKEIGIVALIDVAADLIEAMRVMHEVLGPPTT